MKGMSIVLGSTLAYASICTVFPMNQAQAKEAYQINNKGALVDASTKKVVKGFAVYKSKLYKNGKLYTKKAYNVVKVNNALQLFYKSTLKKGTYVKAYKGETYLFQNGKLKKGIQAYKGRYYDSGVRVETVKSALAKIDKLDKGKAVAAKFEQPLVSLYQAIYAETHQVENEKAFNNYVEAMNKAYEVNKLIYNANPKKLDELNLYERYETKIFKQLATSKPGQKYKTDEANIVNLLNQFTENDIVKLRIALLANDKLLNGDLANNFSFVSSQVISLYKNREQLNSLDHLKDIIDKHEKVETAMKRLATVDFKEDRTKSAKENLAALAALLKQSNIQLPAGISVDVNGAHSFVSVDETLEQSTRVYEYMMTVRLNGVVEQGVSAGIITVHVNNIEELYTSEYRNVISSNK